MSERLSARAGGVDERLAKIAILKAEGSYPSPEQLRAEQALNRQHGGMTRDRLLHIAGFVLAVTLIIGLGVGLATKTEDTQVASVDVSNNPQNAYTGDSPKEHKPVEGLSRLENVQNFLSFFWSPGPLKTKGSPQYRAAQWLADDEHVPIPASTAYDVSYHYVQRYILAVFYYSLSGENWNYQMEFLKQKSVCNWNFYLKSKQEEAQGYPEDEWTMGVQCTDDGEVERIYMPTNGLEGELPAELGYLMALNHLSLFDNEISGSLPEEMKNLESLEFLSIESNLLEGPIPQWFNNLINLKYLGLGDNQLYGNLPDLKELVLLKEVALNDNWLTGPVDVFNYAVALESLFLQGNLFSGPVTDDLFTNLEELTTLDMGSNELEGNFPQHFYSIRILDLHNNSLTGELPAVSTSDSPMRYLSLSGNKFSGPIPTSIDGLHDLGYLDLSRCGLTGAIPDEIGNLVNVRVLNLGRNHFDAGEFPPIWGLSALKELSLPETGRVGQLPAWLEAFENLILLDVHGNQLSGFIPDIFGNMERLAYVMLNRNQLSGSLPYSLYASESLSILLVEKNDLEGDIRTLCNGDGPTRLSYVGADCKQEVTCDCCQLCCEDDEQECKGVSLHLTLDDTYSRNQYIFSEDLVFNAPSDSP